MGGEAGPKCKTGDRPVLRSLDAEARIPHFESKQLFGPSQEIVIEHNHRSYRLRVTAQGKLILTA